MSCTSTQLYWLQDLNAIPFPVVVANCVAWVGYSIVTKDPYVFLANDPGLIFGLFYTFSAYGYADSKVSPDFACCMCLWELVAVSEAAQACIEMKSGADAE